MTGEHKHSESCKHYTEEQYATWAKAARIAAEVLDFGKGLLKNGASVLEVSDTVDAEIYKRGGKPAWATQISFDHVAAHQCAEPNDERVFDNNVIKMDVGVRIDGFIGDNAVTVDLSGKHSDLVKCSRDALDTVTKILQPGATLSEIGRSIQDTITSYGFSPVRNLSGHTISRNIIHDSPSIPNIDTGDSTELTEGQVIAIEPFATNGDGVIYEADKGNLFALVGSRPVRSPFAREIRDYVKKEYGTFPFTTRWLAKQFGLGKTNLALRELMRVGNLRAHPPLIEQAKGLVSQAEHTFLIGDKTKVLTKL